MEKILQKITEIVEHYESGSFVTHQNLADMHRELSCQVYYLTKVQLEFKRKYNEMIYNRPTLESGKRESVASAEIKANHEYPELYMCRKLLEAIKNVSISMTHELKLMENE